MADGFIEIQIIEPIVIEVEAPTIPLIPTVSSPPIGIPSVPPPIALNYECPLSIYCGTDTPCNWSWVMPSLPIPPPIFAKCPAFPEEEFADNTERDGEKENVPEDPKIEATDARSASAEEKKEAK